MTTNLGTPQDRSEAIMLIIAAFDTAAPERVNTPEDVTRAQGRMALRILGVSRDEIRTARREMGQTP